MCQRICPVCGHKPCFVTFRAVKIGIASKVLLPSESVRVSPCEIAGWVMLCDASEAFESVVAQLRGLLSTPPSGFVPVLFCSTRRSPMSVNRGDRQNASEQGTVPCVKKYG